MAYNTSEVLDSKTAFKILRKLNESKEGSYPRQISKDVNAHQSTISDLLKNLREIGLVKRGKRTKAQYYEIDRDYMSDFFLNFWDGKKQEIDEDQLYSIIKDLQQDFEVEEDLDKERILGQYGFDLNRFANTEAEMLITGYFINYLEEIEESTIKEAIYDDFGRAMLISNKITPKSPSSNIARLIDYLDSIYTLQKIDAFKSLEKSLSDLDNAITNLGNKAQYGRDLNEEQLEEIRKSMDY